MPQRKPSKKLSWRQSRGHRCHLRKPQATHKRTIRRRQRIKIDSQENKEFLELIDITKSKEKNK